MQPSDNHNIAGPLRLNTIAALASDIEKRFAILSYTKSFDKEATLVILFDENGSYIGHYSFSSVQFYEDYVTKDVMLQNMLGQSMRAANSPPSMPNIGLLSTDSGCNYNISSAEHKWREPEEAQTEYCERSEDGWFGNVVVPHMALIESLAGVLSPTEAMFVLMHALSSDTRVIYVMTVGFFDNLQHDFDGFAAFEGEENDVEHGQWLMGLKQALRQKLLQVSYAMEMDD